MSLLSYAFFCCLFVTFVVNRIDFFSSPRDLSHPTPVTQFNRNVLYITERIENEMNRKFLPMYLLLLLLLLVCLVKHWFYWCIRSLTYQNKLSSTIFLTLRFYIYDSLGNQNYCSVEHVQNKDLECRDFYENLQVLLIRISWIFL